MQALAETTTVAPFDGWDIERRVLLRTALYVALALAVYGVSFSALAVSSGFSFAQTCAMSLLMFNGASQFAFVGVLGAGGSIVVAVLSALLIGARNATYGVRLGPLLGVRGPRMLLAALFTIDESTALAVAHDRPGDRGRAGRFGFWSAGIAVYLLWNLAAMGGALAAARIGDPRSLGLDTAVAAGLAGLVWPSLRDSTTRAVALTGAAIAVALTPVLPAGVPVILAGLLAVAVVMLVERSRTMRAPSLRQLRAAA